MYAMHNICSLVVFSTSECAVEHKIAHSSPTAVDYADNLHKIDVDLGNSHAGLRVCNH